MQSNKNIVPLKIYCATPNLKTWLRACPHPICTESCKALRRGDLQSTHRPFFKVLGTAI